MSMTIKYKIIIFMLLVVNLFITNEGMAFNNYYVSPVGSNSNNGLSVSTPFKTTTYASSIAVHGDTIFVMQGIYFNSTYGKWNTYKKEQTVKINNKNSPSGNYLVIKPYGNCIPKIRGDGDYIFQIRNSSYIRVEGLDIEGEVNNISLDTALKYQFVYFDNILNKDTFRVPFGTPPSVVQTMVFPILTNIERPTTVNAMGLLVQNSHHIDILKNQIHHCAGTGLRFFKCDYINCFENIVHNNSRRSSIGNHGLVFHSSTSIDTISGYKIFIERNRVFENYNEVYSWNESKTFITPHIDEGKGISMQFNTVANGWTFGYIKIQNNLAYHNGFSGIHANNGIRMDFINNTAFANSFNYGGFGSNFGISLQECDSMGIYNNISVTTFGYALSSANSTHVIVKNNLVDGIIDNDIDAIDDSTLFANPNFVDTLHFKLLKTSPAINNAYFLKAPLNDFVRFNRDTMCDRGALEYIKCPCIN